MTHPEKPSNELSPLQKAFGVISQLKHKISELQANAHEPIAVVGMACRAPTANNTDELWQLLAEGRHGMREVPADRFNINHYYDPRPGQAGKTYTRQAGFIDHVDQFDASFFGISAREAEGMDPQQRLLLEVSWHALEDAGLIVSKLKGSMTGVYMGVTASDYGYLQAQDKQQGEVNPYFNTGVPLNACAGRVSYVLGLQGPSMAIDTACSSSLTAIHLACQALRARECELALAGGVNLTLDPLLYVTLSAAGMMSPDGHCKTFDDSANGYARGEGCGVIVLKRLADARRDGDRIIGQIRGSAVNQDGASSGFTVPNGLAQQQLIERALAQGNVAAHQIDYVEAHGTGTPLGDPIEARALGCVLGQREQRTAPLKVGSIKSNIGHLESAAGVMSVIKVLLAMRHELLPKTLHLNTRNVNIDWDALRLSPVTQNTAWPSSSTHPRLAAVSAFGASGSNAHLVIEQAPSIGHHTQAKTAPNASEPVPILPLTAKSQTSLIELARVWQRHVHGIDRRTLQDVCTAAATKRDRLSKRAAIVCHDATQTEAALQALVTGTSHAALVTAKDDQSPVSKPRVAFLFTGQGGVYRGMGKSLYEQYDVYRQAIDDCAQSWRMHHDSNLIEVLGYEHSDQTQANLCLTTNAKLAQPALFAVQYATARLWQSLGVAPAAVLGHSLGEFAAACIADAFDVQTGLQLVSERGRLMAELPVCGGMLAVRADPMQIRAALQGCEPAQHVDVAVLNSETNTVLAGSEACLTVCQSELKAAGIESRALDVTHGFHSKVMEPMLDALTHAADASLKRLPLKPLNIKYVSGLLGRQLQAAEALDAAYWRRHCRETVQFSSGLHALLEDGFTHFVEIGPGQVLTSLGSQRAPQAVWLTSMANHQDDSAYFTRAIAQGFVQGLDMAWTASSASDVSPPVDLPLYPFDRKRYWFSTTQATPTTNTDTTLPVDQTLLSSTASPTMTTEHIEQAQQAALSKLRTLFAGLLRLSAEDINTQAQLVEMGADSLVLVSGVNAIENEFGVKLEIRQFFEEITTLEAIAQYLVARAPDRAQTGAEGTAGVTASAATPPSAQGMSTQPTMPHTGAQAWAANTPSSAATPPYVLPATQPVANQDSLSQLIMAQTQLMSQHLALLSGSVSQAPHQPQMQSMAAATSAPAASANAAQSAVASAPANKPVIDDRSSPLKALNAPINVGASGMSPKQQQHMQALIERYQRRTAKSKQLAQDCRAQLADSRASVGFRFSTKEILYPLSGAQSTGSRIIDVDSNEYVDLTMGFGVLLFGNKPAHMQGVVEKELEHGFRLGPRLDIMQEVSQLFCEMTGHDRVAFTNSGTEAVMIALRLARAATGRDKIVIFEGAYNGHSDATLAKTVRGPQGELHSEPVAPGIPKNVAKDCLVLEYGNPASLETIRAHAHELGAVLVEPVQSRNLSLQPVDFLRSLRALTTELDIALIFDEMISGFRAHQGGVQALWGIRADLATYGKIIGGGTPIGAVAGASRFMDGIDGGMWQYGDASYPSAQRTYFGGTFCQHPVSMAGCLATLRELKRQGPALQEKLTARTTAFAQTLNDYFVQEDLELRVVHFASTFGFRFPGNLEVFYYHLLEKGVYIWEWRACFLSTAHTDEDLAFVINAIKETIELMRDGGFLPPKQRHTDARTAGHTHAVTPTAADHPKQVTAAAKSEPGAKHAQPANQAKGMAYGLYFFGNYDAEFSASKYELLMQGCRFADVNGFTSIWLPERHFDKFGGFSPNPSVLAAALARETSQIAIRAGSVVMPLHHPLRVAEEWALVDNLSDGRVGIAFASGWHPNDFALAPSNFERNREVTFEGVKTVRQLWRGESVAFEGGDGKSTPLSIYPRPKQSDLPAWLTVVGNPDTYRKAGELGMGILTNLMGQSLEDLEKNIQVYKAALAANGHDTAAPRITVLVHTFLQEDADKAIEIARQPMCDYLLSSLSLFQKMADSLPPNLRDVKNASPADISYIVSKAYERYVAERALIGSPDSCKPMIDRLTSMGITEIACFVDFGVPAADVLDSLPIVKRLLNRVEPASPVQHRLTEAQRQLWMLAQLGHDPCQAYMDPGHARIEGPLDIEALSTALGVIVARHDSLRSTISADGQSQIVHPPAPVELATIDISQATNPEEAAQGWIREQLRQPIDLVKGPLFTPYLLRLGHDHHILTLFAHHIISDGPSMGVLIRELMTLLDTHTSAELPQAMQYATFAQWQEEQRKSPDMMAHENYWLKQFETLPADLSLPADHARPPVQSWQGNRVRLKCPPHVINALTETAAAHGSTPYMVLFGAYSALLRQITGQTELVIGAAYAGRSLPGSHTMVGYGVHLLPILIHCDGDTSLSAHLMRTKEVLLEAYAHQNYPFAWLMNQLPLKRDSSRAPLVSTIFNYEKLPQSHAVGPLTVSPYFGPSAYARVDLTLTVNQIGQDIILEADYNTALFEQASIERLLRSYVEILEQLHQTPDVVLARTKLLSADDEQHTLRDFNSVAQARTAPAVPELIEAQALAQPEAIAVRVYEHEQASLTFAQLNRKANQLAHHLLKLGVKPDQRIGVCLNRTPDLLVALLACLKSGAAYVPMDPDYPADRLRYLAQDADVAALISMQPVIEHTGLDGHHLVLLDTHRKSIDQQRDDDLQMPIHPEQLAYVIFTSGSTGKPKGTMISHSGLSNYIQWATEAYAAHHGDGSPVLGSIGFDATITSLFVPLVAGKPTVLMPEGGSLEALHALSQTTDQYSFIKITPAHLEILNSLRQKQTEPNRNLAKYLVLGGEALPGAYLDPWFEHSATQGVNEYGPTETVVGCCTYTAVNPCKGVVPIGHPIAGTRLYVLDEYLNPVLPGMPGELYIGGAGVARGYLNRPAQSAAVFVPDPFSGQYAPPGARLYKTGDLVKALPDGTLTFLGRIDNQIKLNGFRIEPGEIEAALTDLPTIREALVIKHQHDNDAARLIAYITTAQTVANADFYTSKIIAQLRQQLPAHQVPSQIIILPKMPLTTHGKIDRQQLPAPDGLPQPSASLHEVRPATSTAVDDSAPTGIDRLIHDIWCTVLNRSTIGMQENFFDLGGNSLMLLDVHRRLEAAMPKACEVIDLFRYPTLTCLVQFLKDQGGMANDSPPTNHANQARDTSAASDARVARQLQARKRHSATKQRRTRSSAA